MPRVNLKQVPDSADFSLLPIAKYPARLQVDAYLHDAGGNPMTAPDGTPARRTTQAGDEMWNIEWHILDPHYAGKIVRENLNFTPGGLKRVKIVYARGGFATGDEEDIVLEPEDIDGTYWWVQVEHPDPAKKLKPGQALKISQYIHNKGTCTCATCTEYDGKYVAIWPAVGFAGMEPMKAEDVAKFIKPSTNGSVATCAECGEGKHWHKKGAKGCTCPIEEHPPF